MRSCPCKMACVLFHVLSCRTTRCILPRRYYSVNHTKIESPLRQQTVVRSWKHDLDSLLSVSERLGSPGAASSYALSCSALQQIVIVFLHMSIPSDFSLSYVSLWILQTCLINLQDMALRYLIHIGSCLWFIDVFSHSLFPSSAFFVPSQT